MITNAFSLKDKVALITGGASGIGFGIAEAFVNAGAQVVISGRRKEALVEAVSKLGDHSSYRVNDVTDRKSLPSFIDAIEGTHGSIDILVNNAGVHLKKGIEQTSDEDFYKILNTNLLSVFSLTRICSAGMLKRKQGCILMISSMTALFGMEKVVAYSASKTALTGLLMSMVTEFSRSNVRVNAIAPGWIETDMLKTAIKDDPERSQKIRNKIAMDHFGKPADIGNAAVFLCSEAARYVTGVILPVDGGASVNF